MKNYVNLNQLCFAKDFASVKCFPIIVHTRGRLVLLLKTIVNIIEAVLQKESESINVYTIIHPAALIA